MICDSDDDRFHCVDFEIVAVTEHICMMCISSLSKVLWSSGLLFAVERVVMMPPTAMACAICFQPLDGGGSPAVPLRCLHEFHVECLEQCRKARNLDSIMAIKCPICKLRDSDMAEKEAAAQFLGAGEGSSQSVPEILRSKNSQDDHGTAPTQAAWPPQDPKFHGSSSLVAAGNSPVTVAVPVAPSVGSIMDPQAKRFRWEDAQGVLVERKVPTRRSPQQDGPRDLEAPATPMQSQLTASQFTEDSQFTQYEPRESLSPGVSDDEFKYSFKDATRRSANRREEISDPVVAALKQVSNATNQRELDKAVNSLALFEGFGDESEAYNTITKRLGDIVTDERSHKDLVSDVHFTVRNLVPLPFADAVRALAQGEGWHPECLIQEVAVRAAFVEHHGTQLKADAHEMHKRCPSIACLRGASASARKSSLKTFGDDLICKNNASPADFANREFFLTDGTLRGIRDAIVGYNRCAIVSDECSNTYQTPWSEKGQGIHYLQRSKMCTFVNAEGDDSCTGKGGEHISEYSCLHTVTGQTEAIEWILSPTIGGFCKRMNITFSPDEPHWNNRQRRDDSRRFIHGYFTWLFENVSKEPEVKFLSNEARSLYDAVLSARKDFDSTEQGQEMNRFLKAKLAFIDTDLLRWCSVAHGMMQYACSHRVKVPRTQVMGHFPLMYAVHAWLRQVQLHAAYYKWFIDLKTKTGSLAGEKRLTDLMEEGGSIKAANPTTSLTLPDYIAHEILVWAQPGSCVSSSQVRMSLKNKQRLKGNPKLADLIQDAIKTLMEAGVVKPVADDEVRVLAAPEEEAKEVEVEVEASAKAKPKAKGKAKARGRKKVWFEKCSWVEASASPQALALVTRLLLTADDFHAH